MLNRRPRGSLCWVMAFFIASYQHLLRTSAHHGPRSLRSGVAFPTTSRLHLNSNSTGTGTQFPATANCPCLCLCQLPLPTASAAGTRTQLRYIIIQRPHDRMFNRHQAEITVMQFTGHSHPVHHSVVAQWDLHLVPYYKPQSAHAISFDYWPLECVTSFRCITLE